MKRSFPSCIFLLSLLDQSSINPAHAQSPFWTQTGPLQGEAITTLISDSTGRIYAGTYRGVYTTSNNGTSWVNSNDGLCGRAVSSFATHPNGSFYVITTECGLSVSSNHGLTWSSVHSFFQGHSVAITSTGHIFVGAEQDWGIGRLYHSIDGGNTWNPYDFPRWAVAYFLLVNSNDHVFAATHQGMFRSTNTGLTWDSINVGLTTRSVSSLAMGSTDILFAGTYGKGVFRSASNGSNWQQTSLDSLTIESITVAPEGKVFAAVWSKGIFASSDNGSSWALANTGLTNTRCGAVASKSGGFVCVGTFGNGTFTSTNSGSSWTIANSGMTQTGVLSVAVVQDNIILAGSEWGGGLHRSTDRGNTWFPAGFQGSNPKTLALSPSGRLFAVLDQEGLWRSTDLGSTWTPLVFSGEGEYIRVAFNPAGHVFVGTSDSGVYRSTNNGDSWTRVNSGLSPIDVLDIVTTLNGHLFVGTAGGGIFRSTNSGDSWVAMNSGLSWLWIFALGANVNGDLFAGESGVMYRSTNDGATWTQVHSSTSYYLIKDFAFNTLGQIFAATQSQGVYRSNDNGATWTQVNSGLLSTDVGNLAVDSGGFLYAATGGGGVQKTTQSTTSVGNTHFGLPTAFSLEQNYPNPFNPSTKIRFSVPRTSHVTINVTNVLGQQVVTLTDEIIPPGTYERNIDASDWPSGMYFCRLLSGEYVGVRKLLLIR